MSKWKVLAVVAGLVVAGVGCKITYVVARDLPWTAWDIVPVPGDTAYAARFRESRFQQIKPGMSLADVLELIGPPLEIWYDLNNEFIILRIDPNDPTFPPSSMPPEAERVTLIYSESKITSSSHFMRRLFIGKDDTVTHISSNYYFD